MYRSCKNNPADVVLASLLLAFFADTKVLNIILLAAYPSLSGVMSGMYAAVVLCLFILGFVYQNGNIFHLPKIYLIICIICILWYMATDLFIGTPSVSVPFFCIFTIAAFLIPGIICIDVRVFLLSLLVMPSIGVFYMNKIFLTSILEEGVLSMGMSYSILVPVLANLVYLKYFYMKEKLLFKIFMLPFTAINLYYLVQMTMFGSRGPVLCVILLIISFFVFRMDDGVNVKIHKGRVVLIIVGIIISALLFVPLLQLMSDLLANYDIHVNFIDKFLRMDNTGDMSNGRDSISLLAINGFLDSPFCGNGLAQFENNTKEVYPHNFILQFLYDGGILLTALVVIPVVKSIVSKSKSISASEAICLIFLFFASVPGSLFSGDLWKAELLWMFFGFILSRNRIIIKY